MGSISASKLKIDPLADVPTSLPMLVEVILEPPPPPPQALRKPAVSKVRKNVLEGVFMGADSAALQSKALSKQQK
jgi:hypothetical protein